jgi:hypothetical protein
MENSTRRSFIKQTTFLSAGLLLKSTLSGMNLRRNPTILVVSGWQDVNIGDIAHTPGLLHVLETFLPESNIILWKKSNATQEVRQLLESNFPRIRVLYGTVDQSHHVESPELLEAISKADLMIHGSGPSLVGADNLSCWMKLTTKPFGVFGVTLQDPGAYHTGILKKAAFIFTRETLSIDHLAKVGIAGSHVQFAPDATFFLHIHNRVKAEGFLKENGLQERKFICAIPRLRYTPYHKYGRSSWTQEKIRQVEETNLKYKETDHAKLREAMIVWVRETGNKVLVCPEMTYEVDIMDELLIHPLPEDVKPFVVKRGYWLPDEAASVYEKAHTVLSFECHSPIIAAANGTPFLYLRQPEDTIKGQMYYDLGFDKSIFEIEQTSGKQLADRLMAIWNDYPKACTELAGRMDQVGKIYRDRCNFIQTLQLFKDV